MFFFILSQQQEADSHVAHAQLHGVALGIRVETESGVEPKMLGEPGTMLRTDLSLSLLPLLLLFLFLSLSPSPSLCVYVFPLFFPSVAETRARAEHIDAEEEEGHRV